MITHACGPGRLLPFSESLSLAAPSLPDSGPPGDEKFAALRRSVLASPRLPLVRPPDRVAAEARMKSRVPKPSFTLARHRRYLWLQLRPGMPLLRVNWLDERCVAIV